MPTIPTHHAVGDTGHTNDHNGVVDVLTDHELRITNVQSAQATALVNSGQNNVTIANPSGYAFHVTIPSGTRDNSAYVHSVTYGGKQTFGLDTFGQLRVSASAPGNVPMEVAGYDSTQTADLTRFRQGSTGTVVARIGPDGTVYAPNITPGAWSSISLSSGLVHATATGAVPQYRVTGDVVMLRGSVAKSDSSGFSSSPVTLGSLPSGASPQNLVYFICGTQFSGGYAWARVQVGSDGAIRAYFSVTNFNPTWINLDGISFVVQS
jgi:hypothetical protein